MPRINRIRIVNFSYNNDSRHILDETFNFHGGENALLNLANGGGKSVLVQLFLQPVVPGVRIQGRNIAGFFRKKKLPAYVMIEWKLDGAGGYLLTGIGIVSAEAPGVEEEKNRIRYFTFTSKYTGANAFDIAHIPFVNRNGGVLEVMPFREAREMMSDKERKDPFVFGYFPEDDGDRYGKYLAEFGIAQDEWRNVIAKINDSEGGLEEIFQKYKNSGQLLNDWIIKTVEKAMFRNRSEARRLEEMLESLVQEVVENERFILEKQLLDGFLGTFREQVDALAGLLQGLDGQKKLAGQLSALYGYLTSETGSLQGKYEKNQLEIEACKAEEQRVQLEERSNDYWLRQSEHQEALKRLKTAETMSSETETALQEAKVREKIMQAARLAEEIRRMRSELSGIEEKLSAAKEQYDTDGRVRSLEYSLKILFEETLETIAADLTRLHEEKTEKEKLMRQAGEDLRAADREKSSLDAEKGRLEERKKNFEKDEKEVQRKLGISLGRNLLGEMDAAEIRKTRAALENTRDELSKKIEMLEDEKTAGAARRQGIDNEKKELQAAFSDEKTALNGIDRDIREYEQKEQEIKFILDKYGFDFDLRFDRERLNSAFGQKVKDLEASLEEAARVRDEAAESLHALKNGRLHTSEELASLLAGLDIQYDTGEAYLRGLPPEIRRTVLEGNPVLPYAFIMSRADMDRVAGAVSSLTMRRVIPLIAYEDLGTTVPGGGRVAHTREGIAFACLYEGRMFESEGLVKLVTELEQKRDAALEQHGHFTDAHRAAVSDRAVCARFDYAADYRYGLGKKRNESEKHLLEMESKISTLEEEKRRLEKREGELEQQIKKLQGDLQKAGEAVELFALFIEKEKDYQDCRGRLSDVLKSIADLETRKAKLTNSRESLQGDIGGIERQVWQREKEQQEAQAQYSIYKDAPEAETLEGCIAELEERLKALKEEYSGEIGLLEKRKKELAPDCVRKQKELDKLGLKEEEYTGVVYDEPAAERIAEEIISLERLLKKRRQEEKDAAKEEGAADSAFKNALHEVKRLGAGDPLPPEEIKGDFGERRKRARRRVNELEANNKKISEQIRGYDKIREKIEQLIDPGATEPEKGFIPGQDVTAQAAGLSQAFGKIKSENSAAANRLRNKYAGLKADYRDKNSNIDNIFKGLDHLWDKAGMEFDEFYYLYERMSLHADKLNELIALYEVQLANLERNKKDMVQQSFLHGRRFYEEIQWISDNSRIRLQGRTRPVQMLKIDLQLDNQDAAMQRMKDYIEECILKVREKTRQEKREDEVGKTVARLMSSRELLNVFLGNPYIPVSVFKIDLNMQNSRLKLWEDAVRENSGGEKFVVFFSVLSALMTYTRARAMEAAGADADTDTRVLVMDNPFGPISSEHLLNPLFEIARKHRTQLICLSDLKQNSIMNCFNLIYMLKVRTSAIGSNEYLKFEEIIRDVNVVQNDERLEKAVFRASDVKQISLFDGM
ncbi:MAG: hypothetical protein ACOY3U_07535 [Bacillota bacterium]